MSISHTLCATLATALALAACGKNDERGFPSTGHLIEAITPTPPAEETASAPEAARKETTTPSGGEGAKK